MDAWISADEWDGVALQQSTDPRSSLPCGGQEDSSGADSWGGMEQDTVTQTPLTLDVARGSSFTLSCQLDLQSMGQVQAMVFSWNTPSKNFKCIVPFQTQGAAQDPKGDPSQGGDPRVSLQVNDSLKSGMLILQDAREEDTGVYFCQVSILQPLPRRDLRGNGTVVRITEPRRLPGVQPSHLPYTVATGASLIVLLAGTLLLVKVKGCCRVDQEAGASPDNQIVRTGTVYADIQCSPQAARSRDSSIAGSAMCNSPIIYSELNLSPPEGTEQLYFTRG